MIDKMNAYLSPNRFIPNDYEELTALELIGKQNAKIDEVVEGTNKNESNIENKLDINGDFLGSWHGITHPVFIEGGQDAVILKNSADIENILKSNKIEYILTEDNSLIVNNNTSYEKYTKMFSQLAYTNISTDFENGIGYLKTGLKVNIHLQEQASTDNNFIKAMFDVVKMYNPNITLESFNEQIKTATSNPNDISDKEIVTEVQGLNIKISSNTETNEREIILSIRQELEIPKTFELLKEYKTVKEFKDDSEKLKTVISEKIEKTNEILKNSYAGKYKEIELSTEELEVNDKESFSQAIEINYKGTDIVKLQDEAILTMYEIAESILTKEKLTPIVNANEFKAYIKSLTTYTGAGISGNLNNSENGLIIDELGNYIEPSRLPLLKELAVGISYTPSAIESIDIPQEDTKDESNKEETTNNNTNTNSINKNTQKYDAHIKLSVFIPIKAEGVTSL